MAACGAAGAATLRAHGASGPRGWPVSGQERLALQGLHGQARLIDEAIAEVASGDKAKAKRILEIAAAVEELRRSDEEFVAAARARCGVPEGVAFVISGTEWTTR